MTSSTAQSYDEVPYVSFAFPECHPERMATGATLYGLAPAPVETCRVLEIGCASGGNLIPLAFSIPRGQFVGIDISPRQIAEAKAHADALGLTNVDLKAINLVDLEPGRGPFDYIICHGVYSWVSAEIRRQILELMARHLAPQGIGYISYNTYPGWHAGGMIREMMLYRIRGISDPDRRVRESRALLDLLIHATPEKNSPYIHVLRQEADRLKNHADSYISHEHLEEVNQPFYFHEFVSQLTESGLVYVGDGRLRSAADLQQGEVKAALDRLSDDAMEREQYNDFVRDKTFRRSLVCRAELQPKHTVVLEALERLRVQSVCGPVSPVPDLFSAAVEEFRSSDGQFRLATGSPLVKLALGLLGEAFPSSLPIPELRKRVYERLDRSSLPNSPVVDRSPTALLYAVFQCFVANLIELTTFEPAFAARPPKRPRSSRLARLQAETGKRVVSLRHRNVELTDFERLVIRQLDGERDHRGIVDRLCAAVSDGTFPLHQNGHPITDLTIARPILDRSLPPCLLRLAASCLIEQ
jgi:SAM-dependent methyltransferase